MQGKVGANMFKRAKTPCQIVVKINYYIFVFVLTF